MTRPLVSPPGSLWFHHDDDFDGVLWPAWALWLWMALLRLRCAGLFHKWEQCDDGWPYGDDDRWYCRRCYATRQT